MEQSFAKEHYPAPNPPSGSPGGAVLIGLNVLLERFTFYAFLSGLIIFLDYVIQDGGMHPQHWYAMFMGISALLPIMTGIVVDFFMDKRYAMIAGAFCTALGFTMMAAEKPLWTMIGLTFIAIGSGFCRSANLSYFGYLLGTRGGKMDGGFSILYFCINLGAILSTFLTASMLKDGNFHILFYILGALSLVQCVITGIGLGTGLFPAETIFYAAHDPKPIARALGIIFFPLLIGMAFICFLIMGRLFFGDTLKWIIGSIVFLFIVAAFIMIALSPGSNVVRRNLLFFLLPLVSMMAWASNELSWDLLSAAQISDRGQFYVLTGWLNGIMAGLGALVMGMVLLAASRGGPSYKGASVRIMLGVIVLILGGLAQIFAVQMGMTPILLAIAIMAIGEAVFAPAIQSTLWQLAPNRLKATALGILFSSSYLSGLLVEPFSGPSEEGILPMSSIIGLFIIGNITVILSIIAFILMRNYKETNPAPPNPFA